MSAPRPLGWERRWSLALTGAASMGCLSLAFPGAAQAGLLLLFMAVISSARVPAWVAIPALAILSSASTAAVLWTSMPIDRALAGALSMALPLFCAIGGRSARERAVVVSVLIVALSALRTQDLLFFPLFALWTVGVMSALSVGSERRVHLRPLAVVVPTVALVAASLFWMLPRSGGASRFSGPGHLIGVGDQVVLGELGPLLDDPSPVLRLSVMEPDGGSLPSPLYVRASVADHFDGHQWRATAPLRGMVQSGESGVTAVRVVQSERPGGALFSVGRPVGVLGVEARTDALGNLRTASDGPVEWTLLTKLGSVAADLDDGTLARTLQVPGVDRRLQSAAAELSGSTPSELASAVGDWLGRTATYAREPWDAGEEDPLAAFLFEQRRGHCEYFASSAVVLLRLRGVPARLVHGLVTTRRAGAGGEVLLRASDAHAWVEYYEDGQWRVFDPTPGSLAAISRAQPDRWDELSEWWLGSVVQFDGRRQRAAAHAIGGAVGAAAGVRGPVGPYIGWILLGFVLGGSLLAGRAVLWPWIQQQVGLAEARPAGQVARCWAEARAGAESRCGNAPRHLPPLAAAEWLAERDPAGGILVDLAWLHYRVAHNGEGDQDLAQRAEHLVERARALVVR